MLLKYKEEKQGGRGDRESPRGSKLGASHFTAIRFSTQKRKETEEKGYQAASCDAPGIIRKSDVLQSMATVSLFFFEILTD